MMLRLSLNCAYESNLIERAVEKTLAAGYRTRDIYVSGNILLSTTEMTDKIIENLK
jgi:Isocitrate/isopropylmalate dehydrogenase